MTESEWLTGKDPVVLMCGLKGYRVSCRKQELVNCAVARAVCNPWPDASYAKYIELIERQIDEHDIDEFVLDEVSDTLSDLANESSRQAKVAFETNNRWTPEASALLRRYASIATVNTAFGSMEWWYWLCDLEYSTTPVTYIAGCESMVIDDYRANLPLLRCIVGNPFHPVTFLDSWRSENAVALASVIYAERAFDRLPILADALQEAGCDHPDVLEHCRGTSPHARGCWVVDGVLGKS